MDYGRAVEAELARLQPGSLRLFVTAFSANEIADQLSSGEVDENFVLGERYRIVRYYQKEISQIARCISELVDHERELARLDSARLQNVAGLDDDCRRAIALGLAFVGGTSGRVVRPGGLSGNTTALLECFDAEDRPVGRCFLKIGSPSAIDVEVAGFQAIRFRWPPNALPHLACRLKFGIGTNHALLFTQAPATEDLFDICRADPEVGAAVIRRLGAVIPSEGAAGVTLAIGELRQRFARDEQIEPHLDILQAAGLADVEAITVEVLDFIQHGDLHGANVLVGPNGDPFLIDFGRTGSHVGPLDPVLLKMSFMFHPGSALRDVVPVERCERWAFGDYADGTPLAEVVHACRDLAVSWGHSELSVAAVGWVQALRHLKFPSTLKERAISIALSCAERLRGA